MGTSQKRTLGCFAWGCITVIILFVVAVAAVSYWTKSMVDNLVNTYTDEAPLTLPVVEISDEDLVELRQRVEVFRDAVDGSDSEVRLELTANELNALILHDEKMKDLKGKVYLDIRDNQLAGEVSLPLGELDIPFGEGRYFNGYGVFDVSLERRGLSVKVEAFEINGKALPESFMKGFEGKNILQNAEFDDETEELLERVKTLEITDGKVVLELAPSVQAEVSDPAELEVEAP